MIVEGWYELTRSVDKAVPCYTPVQSNLGEARCGDCEGCRDYEKVEDALAAVEVAIENALDEAARGGVL